MMDKKILLGLGIIGAIVAVTIVAKKKKVHFEASNTGYSAPLTNEKQWEAFAKKKVKIARDIIEEELNEVQATIDLDYQQRNKTVPNALLEREEKLIDVWDQIKEPQYYDDSFLDMTDAMDKYRGRGAGKVHQISHELKDAQSDYYDYTHNQDDRRRTKEISDIVKLAKKNHILLITSGDQIKRDVEMKSTTQPKGAIVPSWNELADANFAEISDDTPILIVDTYIEGGVGVHIDRGNTWMANRRKYLRVTLGEIIKNPEYISNFGNTWTKDVGQHLAQLDEHIIYRGERIKWPDKK